MSEQRVVGDEREKFLLRRFPESNKAERIRAQTSFQEIIMFGAGLAARRLLGIGRIGEAGDPVWGESATCVDRRPRLRVAGHRRRFPPVGGDYW